METVASGLEPPWVQQPSCQSLPLGTHDQERNRQYKREPAGNSVTGNVADAGPRRRGKDRGPEWLRMRQDAARVANAGSGLHLRVTAQILRACRLCAGRAAGTR